jgi:hypothetical protein
MTGGILLSAVRKDEVAVSFVLRDLFVQKDQNYES